ncbi:hypothetical protein Q3V23_22125 [Streptomyces sp. VNUA116]|uniref:hypothetical protein n=1 Tax=Streptomyces sp. VNUA116 TaxID=3062449 RepID=UPI002674C81E|nr:hypothetical protein [Streptomyces sp. VNUA116]WKU46534.1 hypothetical protein Q3V23_22125 [Streptomyces sp. VNUA116]
MTDHKDDRDGRNGNGTGTGGGIAIGRMTGGAVAAGERAQAEHRGTGQRNAGRDSGAGGSAKGRLSDEPAGAPVNVPSGVPRAGGVAVGELSGGAVAAGREARAVDSSRDLLAVTPELLEAVTALRGQLPLLVRSDGDGVDAVGDELAGLEAEARRTGRTQRGRLVRLRALLSSGATAVGGLASAAAVAEAAGRLLT